MIGVVASEADQAVVGEFFELFKTPWEFYRSGVNYDVLICSNSPIPQNNSRLVLLYGPQRQSFEESRGIKTSLARGDNFVSFCGERMPIYGNCLVFEAVCSEVLHHDGTKSAAAISAACGNQVLVRLGFDLFGETHHLLTQGQPPELASIPTLELHISLLRELIVNQGVTLIEILSVPPGHRFIVCLTHDVDQPRVRYHKCDHTMFGFLYRASIGSVINFCSGRRSLQQVALNWKAAFSLPLVFAGLAKDFWNQLEEYLQLEKGLASTFFFIPMEGYAGIDSNGQRSVRRASRYALADIADDLKTLLSANREIGVHGLDAWCDSVKGRQERERIQEITGTAETGVRMHWLYFNSQAPLKLEKAGFAYDSTVGYNETIGYRAGTSQVFKHPGVDRLLELPLHIMDTALFYPSCMNLSGKEARAAMRPLIENATKFGGVLTINWHDRSLGPERLWGEPYRQLLSDLKSSGGWFATASEAVSWFRKRRLAKIDNVVRDGTTVRARVSMGEPGRDLPGLRLRLHCSPSKHMDVLITDSTEVQFSPIR
jgi:peptidoglycan/xylan/chitin deacetylase (PgdA/CDA1 family)